MEMGKTYLGIEQIGERERNREQQIRGEREAALVENRNGMGKNGC